MLIEITVPEIDYLVKSHNEEAECEIARMAPSRSYGAETNLSSWRRALTAVTLDGSDGYAFQGHSLKAKAPATLEIGTVIVAVDTSWARAKWYAGSFVKPIERSARLLLLKVNGLETLIESSKKTWARELLGYLATNQSICDAAGIKVTGTNPPGPRSRNRPMASHP